MGVMRSTDYHDYVFVDDKFIGAFEEMYQNCEDPWHQEVDGLSEREPLRRLALKEIRRLSPKSILDVGCGLGYFTHQMSLCVPRVEVLAVDMSQTAVRKATARYPACQFQVLDALELGSLRRAFDLIVCNELLWYVVWELDKFFKGVRSVAHENSFLMIMQFLPPPEEQRYGRDVMVGVEGLLNLIPFRVIKTLEVNRLLSSEQRDREGKAGSHRALILCDELSGRPLR